MALGEEARAAARERTSAFDWMVGWSVAGARVDLRARGAVRCERDGRGGEVEGCQRSLDDDGTRAGASWLTVEVVYASTRLAGS